ncbi:hypothetical protein AVEN_260604-1 [Araneus ventricosus]|uniref:Uncharacterized protein n=1 Tax=Araneus ventricosus TaxID=182803 RepID=A0A4Y2IHX5_ARAVE|nr:hypothetical protein AVEN_260604-1 [Araneus ventricosus]
MRYLGPSTLTQPPTWNIKQRLQKTVPDFASIETASSTEASVPIVIEPPEDLLKEEYEDWISIDVDIPVATTSIDLEIFQAVCQQDQAINVDDSDGDKCVEENLPREPEM